MRPTDGQVKCEILDITFMHELTVDTGNLNSMNISIAVMLS
jgi:hypothetical protein